jgi:hypothetical protein
MGNWECLLAIKEAKKADGNGDEWLHPCEEEERRGVGATASRVGEKQRPHEAPLCPCP